MESPDELNPAIEEARQLIIESKKMRERARTMREAAKRNVPNAD